MAHDDLDPTASTDKFRAFANEGQAEPAGKTGSSSLVRGGIVAAIAVAVAVVVVLLVAMG